MEILEILIEPIVYAIKWLMLAIFQISLEVGILIFQFLGLRKKESSNPLSFWENLLISLIGFILTFGICILILILYSS